MLFCSSLCFVALHKLRFSFLKQITNYLAPEPGHQDLPFLAFHDFRLLGLSDKKEQASTDLPWYFVFILTYKISFERSWSIRGANKKRILRERQNVCGLQTMLRVNVDSKRVVFSLIMNSLFYLKMETGRGVIQNTATACWTQGATMFRMLQLFENVRGPITG